jgi:hypothetical protein
VGKQGVSAYFSWLANGEATMEFQIDMQQCSVPEHEPQFTSRICVKHVDELTGTFTEFKKWFVNEIGFGVINKVDLRRRESASIKTK